MVKIKLFAGICMALSVALAEPVVYTTDYVNVRERPTLDAEVLITAPPDTQLEKVCDDIVDGWDSVKINDRIYFVANDYLTEEEPEEKAKDIEEQLIDLRLLSAIVWAEAGNQCLAGQQAVGIVVMNRVESEVYEDSVYDVITSPYQFTPVSNGSFYTGLYKYDNKELPEDVLNAARYALIGNKSIYYNDTFYNLDGYLYFSRYVKGAKLQVQDHQFK